MAESLHTADMPFGSTLTIEIRNRQPVELTDLTRSLLSLAEEFKHYVEANDPEAAASEVTLYVKQIRTGSIIADLVAVSPQLLQGISYTSSTITFAKYLAAAYDFLSGKRDDKPELTKQDYENLSEIVEPVAKDRGAQLNIATMHGNVYLTVDSTEANAIQNEARRQIEKLREPETRIQEKVVLYWYQARADANSKTGDKGIIESISPRPVKVLCATDAIKSKMIFDDANPFKYAYVVDVIVETVRNKPAAYKVITVHERIEPAD